MAGALKELLGAAASLKLPERLKCARSKIDADYVQFENFISKNPDARIYGVNVFPGHQDRNPADALKFDKLQRELLVSHAISGEEPYSEFQARCIGFAKAYATAAGGALISGSLYDEICKAVCDPSFKPSVPRSSSYSCGDVIPGAHWANDLLAKLGQQFQLKAGEGMALISGAYIHVGLSAAFAQRLRRLWSLFVESTKLTAALCDANPKEFERPLQSAQVAEVLRYITDGMKSQKGDTPQDPVSLRATHEVLSALHMAISDFAREADRAILTPSGNPLMLGQDAKTPHPQASFLNFELTIRASALIDTLLMCGWCSISRTSYLLGGQVPGIALDGKRTVDDFGFIQWPKLMQAKLEVARSRGGHRPYVSGSATSYGIEDLWSFGVMTTQSAEEVMDEIEKILCMEILLGAACAARFKPDFVSTQLKDIPAEPHNPSVRNRLYAWAEGSVSLKQLSY